MKALLFLVLKRSDVSHSLAVIFCLSFYGVENGETKGGVCQLISSMNQTNTALTAP